MTNNSARRILTPQQCERLQERRALWELEEGEERLERLRQREEDLETAEAFSRILAEARFEQGANLSLAQMSQALALARTIAPNPNLDARLLRQPNAPENLNQDLRDLLFGESPLPVRLSGFLARRRAGGQTALQLLCLAFPQRYPLYARGGWQAFQLSPAQEIEARQKAQERYALAATSDLPEKHAGEVLKTLAGILIYEEAKETLECADYLELYRLLSQSATNRPRRASFYLPIARPETTFQIRETHAATSYVASVQAHPPAPEPRLSHAEVLAALERFAAQKGYQHTPLALRNYYLSLRAKPFCLLAGVSGSGKTLLTRLFAEFMTGNLAERYLLLPVRPDWIDSAPLLGYINLLAGAPNGRGRYVSTPFLEFLFQAAQPQNRYKAFFVCLDEMNLARIEHYGAELLSALESPQQGLALPDGSRPVLPQNLFFTGSLNLDEATHTLSRKTLDRANVLLFEAPHLEMPPLATSQIALAECDALQATFLSGRELTFQESRNRLQSLETRSLHFAETPLRVLQEINSLLRPHGFGFAYRVRDEVLRYCAHSFDSNGSGLLSQNPTENLSLALDLQILQKVLPRLTGSQSQLKEPLETLLAWSEGTPYAQSRQRIETLRQRLRRDGFVSFDAL